MMIFWVVAALLIVAALLFILPPLLQAYKNKDVVERNALNISIYRDQLIELERDFQNDVISQEQYEQGRLELESRLLEDVPNSNSDAEASVAHRSSGMSSAIIVGLVVPVFAVGLYLSIGTPESIDTTQAFATQEDVAPTDMPDDMADQIIRMVTQLEERLKSEPNDTEGWAMLGRSYLAMERFDDSIQAFDKAVALDAKNPQILADYADAIAMVSGESLEGRPLELVEQALIIDPTNNKALWLAGTAAFERAEFQQAIDYWQTLYDLLPAGAEIAITIAGNITEAESLLSGRARSSGSEMVADGQVSVSDKADERIVGVASLDKSLAAKVNGSDTVFVFARAANGPRMPLAVMRAQVQDLPFDFSLDSSMAINPNMSLAQFSEVIVVARISKSGNATPQSGDLQGMSQVIQVGSSDAKVVISEIIP